jgi:hypothetical protein
LLLIGFLSMSFGDKVPQTRELYVDEKDVLQTLPARLDDQLVAILEEPTTQVLLEKIGDGWTKQEVDWPTAARQTVRDKLELPPDAKVNGGQVRDVLEKQGDLTDAQRQALDKAQLICRLKAAEEVRRAAYNAESFEVPDNIRPWVAYHLGLADAAKVKGEQVLALRTKILKKEAGSVPDDVQKWLKKIKPPGSEITVLSRFLGDQVSERLVNATVPIIPYGQDIPHPRNSYMLLSIIAIIVFWLGCNNAAKEIVKEEAIYSRERAVNLGILPYLGSKFLVLGLLSAGQVLLLLLLIYGTLNLAETGLHAWGVALNHQFVPPAQYCLRYDLQFLVLVLLSLTGVAAGLLLSASVSSPDRASVLLPYMLIPQIILCGSMISVTEGVPHYLATVCSPVYWAYRAIHLGSKALPEKWSAHEPYQDGIGVPCAALGIQLLVLLLLTIWCLRRKDVGGDLPDWLSKIRTKIAARFTRKPLEPGT